VSYESLRGVDSKNWIKGSGFFDDDSTLNLSRLPIIGAQSAPLVVVASQRDFHQNEQLGVKDCKVQYYNFKFTPIPARHIPDPVVLQPVQWKSEAGTMLKFYLVITAWGDEAKDPALYNVNRN